MNNYWGQDKISALLLFVSEQIKKILFAVKIKCILRYNYFLGLKAPVDLRFGVL